MDVDNLGKLFQEGFANPSPARVASLSFALRLFFEGYLPELAKGEKNTQTIWKQDITDQLYVQYSGGDDVFVVGAWDALPELARRVREAFREYTTGHPALTLSAGVALAEEKFPLYQAAEMADEAERAAKAITRDGERQKDAVTFLEQTLDWDELAKAQRRAYTLADFVESSHISRAVLQTILALRAQVARAKHDSKGKVEYGRWTWLAAYQLTRAIQTIKKENTTAKAEIEEIQTVFLGAQAAPMELAGLAARWAQYLTRGG
jgi:CRISPR-associated protein Csm1